MEILQRFEGIVSERPRPVVMEFGACDGYHSRIMIDFLIRQRKDFIYHLFEPKQDLKISIENNLKSYLTEMPNKVKFFHKAIGAQMGEVDFYESSGMKVVDGHVKEVYYGSSSIRKPKLCTEVWEDMRFTLKKCIVDTFDNHLAEHQLTNEVIDFIWADIQGAEVDLIMGGKKAFDNVRYFYTEYVNDEHYEGEIGLNEILKMLPNFEIVEDYGTDVLLKNITF